MTRILITGAAGFIGYHLTLSLSNDKNLELLGVDNMNNYYDVQLKIDRLLKLGIDYFQLGSKDSKKSFLFSNFSFQKIDIADKGMIFQLFETFKPEIVINLAAQAGVRYSLINPHSYIDSNIQGFINLLENCRHIDVKHFIYASSSSVYGLNKTYPFQETDNVDHPISVYSATKRANELMAHTYSHLYNIPTTGLRFFTVYGPWGRPDMALFIFTDAILNGKVIPFYNYGEMSRDFTFVDDVVSSLKLLINLPPRSFELRSQNELLPNNSVAPFRVLNVGSGRPIKLLDFISAIENKLGIKAKLKNMPMQPGDVVTTYASTSELEKLINYTPTTTVANGVNSFLEWYLEYYNYKSKNI